MGPHVMQRALGNRRNQQSESQSGDGKMHGHPRIVNIQCPSGHQSESDGRENKARDGRYARPLPLRREPSDKSPNPYGHGHAEQPQTAFQWRISQHSVGHQRHCHHADDQRRADQDMSRARRREIDARQDSSRDERFRRPMVTPDEERGRCSRGGGEYGHETIRPADPDESESAKTEEGGK